MNNKYTALVCPCQSGKTKIFLDYISEKYEEDTNIINIIFVDNSILQSEQLLDRIGMQNVFYKNTVVVSSKSKVCKNMDMLPVLIIGKGYRNILVCSNSTRVKNITELINTWGEYDINNRFKFQVFVDEADRSISMFKPHLEGWNESERVSNIMLISATPYNILKELGEINIVKLENTYNEEDYNLFSESEFKIYELEKGEKKKYIDHTLDMASKNNHIRAGNVFYIPGAAAKISHYNIKNKCLDYNMNVLTLNSDGCKLFCDADDNTKYVKIDTNGKELSKILADLYINKLHEKPFVITGSLCISRGVSLSSPDMLITHAILSPCYNNINNLAQSGGRINNNLKQCKNWRRPIVYCTKKVKSSICLSETRASDLAIKAFKFDKDTVSMDDYRIANKAWSVKSVEVNTLYDVKEFLNNKVGKNNRFNLCIHAVDGFLINNYLRPAKKIEELTADDRVLREHVTNISLSRCMSKTNGYLIIPVYETIESKTCKFQIRYKIT
jgi:hypothetical protein